MTLRLQPLFAGIIVGGTFVTSLALAVPQIVAGRPVPVIVEIAAASEAAQDEAANPDDSAVDMNHWQETGGLPPSPYIPGKKRKK